MNIELLPWENAGADRVRANTAPEVNDEIDRRTRESIEFYGRQSAEVISRRITELDQEWDIERYLQMNASALAFSGLFCGLAVSRKWLALPALVLPFLFMHAVQGWCPPVPFLRKRGVRTQREIDAEKYALKALRGDFDGLREEAEPRTRAVEALRVARA